MNVNYTKLRQVLAELPRRDSQTPPAHRRASVCLPLFDRTETFLLAIRKTDTAGYHWRNQIALPGGFVDATDPSATDTALRELNEELGIPPSDLEVLGELGEFRTATSDALVAVTVGRWRCGHPLSPENSEVAQVLEIRLRDLVTDHLAGRCHGKTSVERGPDPCYLTSGGRIWGLTARILDGFLELILRSRCV